MSESARHETIALLIPAWNAAQWLPRLLNSAHAQTEPFDEIWVYDDCSTDDTADVAARFGARVLRGDVNKGCSAGKNALAAVCQADWLHFHDADDELLPNFVTLARRWIANTPPDVVLFDYEYRDNVTQALIATRRFDHHALTQDPRRYAIREQINAICGLYRREAFLKARGYELDPEVLFNEDVALHIKLAFAGLSFGAESEVSIINYRIGGSMSTGNQAKCFRAHHEVMRRVAQRPDATPYHQDIGRKLWHVAGLLAACGDWVAADRAVRDARKLMRPDAAAGAVWYRLLACFAPRFALRVREYAIRWLKPSLRP